MRGTLLLLTFLLLSGCADSAATCAASCESGCDAAGRCLGGSAGDGSGATGGAGSGGGSAGSGAAGGSAGEGAGAAGGSAGEGAGAAGAGSSGGAGGGPVPTLTVDEYCAQHGLGGCSLLTACGYYTTQAACESFYGSINYCESARAALKDGRVRFDAALAASCVALRAGSSCAVPTEPTTELDCSRVFDGQMANGQSCLEDSDCASGSYCTSYPTTCGGTCQPRKPVGSIAERPNECEKRLGFYGGRCVTLVPPGGACSPIAPEISTQPCALWSTCDGTQCRPFRAIGQTCSTPYECLYGECRDGTCGAYVGLNGACRPGNGLRCAADLTCLSEKCVPLGGGGEACVYWSDCQRDHYCSSNGAGTVGTCLARKAAQSPCDVWWECVSGTYCDNTQHLCLPEREPGAPCVSGAECRAPCNLSACWTPSCTEGVCSAPFCVDPTP